MFFLYDDHYDQGMEAGQDAVKKTGAGIAKKGAKIAAKGAKTLIAAILKLLAPYALVIGIVFLLVVIAYFGVFGAPLSAREERASGFLNIFDTEEDAWSEEEDQELWSIYQELCALDPDYTECQRLQAEDHSLPVGILAGIDRLIAEDIPEGGWNPQPEKHNNALQSYLDWESTALPYIPSASSMIFSKVSSRSSDSRFLLRLSSFSSRQQGIFLYDKRKTL